MSSVRRVIQALCIGAILSFAIPVLSLFVHLWFEKVTGVKLASHRRGLCPGVRLKCLGAADAPLRMPDARSRYVLSCVSALANHRRIYGFESRRLVEADTDYPDIADSVNARIKRL